MDTATDYFALLGIARTLKPDPAALRRQYYAHSQQAHPDRAGLHDAAAQANALQRTAQLNEALRTLSHPLFRLAHLLDLEGHPLPENYALSPDFMMEMMELNEQAEENPEVARHQTEALQNDWQQQFERLTQQYESGGRSEDLYQELQEAYFRKKYLDRLMTS